MKKLILLICSYLFIQSAQCAILEAGVAIEDVPKPLFGEWRVHGEIESSNSYSSFKPKSIDFWELSRVGETITLSNPLSGANDKIQLKTVQGNLVIFNREVKYDNNKILIDTVSIRLNGNKFSGTNDLTLEMYSLIDGHLMSTKKARYLITGEKISGESIIQEETEEAPVENLE